MSKLVYFDCEFLNDKTGHKPGTKSSILKDIAEKLEKEGTVKILSKPEETKKPIEKVEEKVEKSIESSEENKMVEKAPKNKMVGSSPKNKSIGKSKKSKK